MLPKSATGAAQSRKTCQPTPPESLKSNLGIMKGAKNARAANIVVVSFVAGMLANPAATQTGQVTDRDDVLRHLNAVIRWYKDSTTKIRAGQEPSDTIYVTNAQNLGAQAVRLAFQSSRADVTLNQQNGSGTNPGNQDQSGAAGPSWQKYAQMEVEASQRIADDQKQIEALKKQISSTSKNRATLIQQEQALEGKLALDKATLDAVETMKNFVENTNTGGTGLEGSINDLARSVPEVFGTLGHAKNNTAVVATPAAATAAPAKTQSSSGMIGELMMLYGQMENIQAADQLLDETETVGKIGSDLRGPMRKQLVAILQSGKDLANRTGVPKEQYDALTARFDQLSAALLPLSEEIVVLDQCRSNLLEWKRSLANESAIMLRALIFRVLGIAIALGVILGLAEAWRRLTFRYVHDPRCRRQFLLLRRFVTGFLIGIVVILGFVSEFSSLATFAGFVTAGIAVGLQTVLLSVAVYFFCDWALWNARRRSNHRGRSYWGRNRRRDGAPVLDGTGGHGSGLVFDGQNRGILEFRSLSSHDSVVQTIAGHAIHVARGGSAARGGR